jgi:ribosome-binding factor A
MELSKLIDSANQADSELTGSASKSDEPDEQP